MTAVQFLAAGAVIFLLGVGVGVVGLYWFGKLAVQSLGYMPADMDCVQCHRPCRWFSGRMIAHWSSGGYSFCSTECVQLHHQQRAEHMHFVRDLAERTGRPVPGLNDH